MRANDTLLLGRWRRPRRGGAPKNKPANGNEIDTRLLRIKDRLPRIDLDELSVRVHSLEVRPKRGPLIIHAAEPQRRAILCLQQFIQTSSFRQPIAVEIDRSCMVHATLGIEPIPMQHVAVRVELTEETIRQRYPPHIALKPRPSFDDLGARDLHTLARRSSVDDPVVICGATARRRDALTVDAFMNRDHVTRERMRRRCCNCLERPRHCPIALITAAHRDVVLACSYCARYEPTTSNKTWNRAQRSKKRPSRNHCGHSLRAIRRISAGVISPSNATGRAAPRTYARVFSRAPPRNKHH